MEGDVIPKDLKIHRACQTLPRNSTLQSVFTAPDLQRELLSHLHLVKNHRFKFQVRSPSVTLRAEQELLIH